MSWKTSRRTLRIPEALKRLAREDPEFRAAMVGDRNLLDRVLSDEEVFLHISPSLYFEILLRRSYHELETITYTEEREGRASIPVFDTPEVLEFMERPGVVEYMASMMASFTRIHSYTVPVRVRKGIRRRVRYNDMDIDSLVKFAANADPEQRFAYYKRIADVCLFLSGVFPDSAQRGFGRMVGGAGHSHDRKSADAEDYRGLRAGRPEVLRAGRGTSGGACAGADLCVRRIEGEFHVGAETADVRGDQVLAREQAEAVRGGDGLSGL